MYDVRSNCFVTPTAQLAVVVAARKRADAPPRPRRAAAVPAPETVQVTAATAAAAVAARAPARASAAGGDWSLSTSIWAPRAKWCDAKDLYDTEAAQRLRLDVDWARALGCGLEKFILKADDDGSAEEVAEVYSAAWAFHSFYFLLFDHYASLGGDSVNAIS